LDVVEDALEFRGGLSATTLSGDVASLREFLFGGGDIVVVARKSGEVTGEADGGEVVGAVQKGGAGALNGVRRVRSFFKRREAVLALLRADKPYAL
jgi:hypothetical protein